MRLFNRRLVLILIGLAFFAGFAVPTSLQASADDRDLRGTVFLIGDSYTAGNGAGDYNGDAGTYRSPNNWGELYNKWLQDKGVHVTLNNFAYSGHTTSQVIGQIEQVSANAELVMMTLGGNDLGFEGIVKYCFAVGVRHPSECRSRIEQARTKLGDVETGSKEVFKKLQKKLSANGKDTTVVLVGYPHLSLESRYFLNSSFDIYPAATEIRKLADEAAKLQAQWVREWNAKSLMQVTYVSTVRADFSGHEPNPSALIKNDYRWINEFNETDGYLSAGGKTESSTSWDQNHWYHPNKIGHEKMALAVRKALGIPDSLKTITSTSGDIDVAFVIDTTGSMSPYISAVQAQVKEIIAKVANSSSSARFSLVSYRDHPVEGGDLDDYPFQVDSGFTDDAEVVQAAVDTLYAGGGGDGPESVYSGVMAALDMDWRPGVRKIAIVLGDAPPKDPEPVTGFTWSSVAAKAYAVDPVSVYGVDTGDLLSAEFAQLVEASGGILYPASATDVPASISAAITTELSKPFAWIQGPHVAKVGATLTLDGRASYAVEGELVGFEWDVDGDGEFDLSTDEPTLTHTFTSEFEGAVGLRVTSSTDTTAVGTTMVYITDDGDIIPRAEDNCPDVANHGQTDFDGDGIGDECDDSPGYPTEDLLGVFETDEQEPVVTPTPSAPIGTPTVTVTVTTTPTVDLYTTPGFHRVNDRIWFTACEPYSQTTRCRTDIWSTQVAHVGGGKFSSRTGWHFNNLTYLPEMTRAQWGSNPLANGGDFSSAGRRWRTECDTAVTGRNGCRSFILVKGVVEAERTASGGYRYKLVDKWVFNNMVRFR